MNAPFQIGLTGGIGSGKSTAAAEFGRLGAELVSGDALGRLALDDSPEILAAVRDRFGDGVFDERGNVRRRLLGERVFADAAHARWLTELTFPVIYALWRERVSASQARAIVFDAALIFEWGIHEQFDYLILVYANPAIAAQRLAEEGRLTPAEAAARLAAQWPAGEKMSAADLVLINDGTRDQLIADVRRIWSQIIVAQLQKTT